MRLVTPIDVNHARLIPGTPEEQEQARREWQQHKRTTYAAFLGAGSVAANSDSAEDARAFQAALSQVMVTAHETTRSWLRTLDLPTDLGQRDKLVEIEERLVDDVGIHGPAR